MDGTVEDDQHGKDGPAAQKRTDEFHHHTPFEESVMPSPDQDCLMAFGGCTGGVSVTMQVQPSPGSDRPPGSPSCADYPVEAYKPSNAPGGVPLGYDPLENTYNSEGVNPHVMLYCAGNVMKVRIRDADGADDVVTLGSGYTFPGQDGVTYFSGPSPYGDNCQVILGVRCNMEEG